MRKLCSFLLHASVVSGGLIALAVQLWIIGAILLKGLPVLSPALLMRAPDPLAQTPGLLPHLLNTLLLMLLTLALALPLGLGCALWLERFSGSSPGKRAVEAALGALAAIPSAVYGLFGFLLFGVALKLRYSLLSGALTMALLVLPTAVKAAQAALEAVPNRLCESALALGATDAEMLRTVLLPGARRGIASAALLLACRAAGESAALLLTAGTGVSLPARGLLLHLLRSGATLAVGVYQSVLEGDNRTAFAAAAVLLLLIALFRRWTGRMGG